MTILLLIRHASNDFLKEGRLPGWTPGLHINAQGQREAEAMARRTARLPLEAIYSSPLERAVDTASALAACHKLPVQIRHGLGEGNAGEWTGRLIKELLETETWRALQAHPVGVKLPGGESIDEVQTRLVAEIDAIAKAHPHGIVAIVSHADPLKSVISHYLNWDLNQYQRIAIHPASVTILAVEENKARLVVLNHCGDLPQLEKPKPEPKDARKEDTKMTEPNLLFDLNPVTRVTAGAVGEPGQRTFFLQGRRGTQLVTLLAEKDQIVSLGNGIFDLLDKLGERTAREADISGFDLALEEPLEPVFRIGQLGLGYDRERDLLVIVAYAATAEENPALVDVVRFWCTRGQTRALAQHALQVAAAGRPVCVLCGRPIDPVGHFCPRRNGHGEHAALG